MLPRSQSVNTQGDLLRHGDHTRGESRFIQHGSGMLNSNMEGRVWKVTPTVTTLETLAKIHDIIMADRPVMKHYIANDLGISQDRNHAVIRNKRHMSKVSARCVPKGLGPDLKWTSSTCQGEILSLFRQIPMVFFRDLWLWMRTGFQPEIKQQLKRWKHQKHLGSLPHKEAKTWISAFSGMQKECCWWTT